MPPGAPLARWAPPPGARGAWLINTRPPRPLLQGYGSGGGGGLPSPHDLRTSPTGGGSGTPGSLVLYSNATVWTGDAAAPHADAFLVDPATGRFAFVGDRRGALSAAAGRAQAPPKEVDLQGTHVIPGKQQRGCCLGARLGTRPAVPLPAPWHILSVLHALSCPHTLPPPAGLIDAHLHLIPGGLSLSRLDLSAIASQEQLAAAVAAAAAGLRPGQWLVGGGWDESRWGGGMPTAEWIDAGERQECCIRAGQHGGMVACCSAMHAAWPAAGYAAQRAAPNPLPPPAATGGTPAWLLRHDAHMGLANSAALRLAGVSAATANPPGGAVLRGPNGEPTGLLTDAAMQLVAGGSAARGRFGLGAAPVLAPALRSRPCSMRACAAAARLHLAVQPACFHRHPRHPGLCRSHPAVER